MLGVSLMDRSVDQDESTVFGAQNSFTAATSKKKKKLDSKANMLKSFMYSEIGDGF